MGDTGEDIGALYDKIKEDLAFRKERAEKAGQRLLTGCSCIECTQTEGKCTQTEGKEGEKPA
jgi:hypothetical protein